MHCHIICFGSEHDTIIFYIFGVDIFVDERFLIVRALCLEHSPITLM